MSLSTSSFKVEWKVIAMVFIVIGMLEVLQLRDPRRRGIEGALMRHFPVVADELKIQSGTHVILLGNSLTQNGYDMPLLRSLLVRQGDGNLHVEKVALTGSSPIEWYHLLANCFVSRGKSPDVIVINMSPTGIADAVPAGYRIGWLANETTWHDVPEVLLDDLDDIEVDGQYLQARVSPLYADRWDIRVGILWRVDHDLWDGMRWVNAGQSMGSGPSGQARAATSSLLKRMLELSKSQHIKVILVAMPAREGYVVDPTVQNLLKKYGADFLDCRMNPRLRSKDFEDGWHLNPQGATLFTTYMAGKLPRVIDSRTPRGEEKPD
jgi:hypothetical protein